MRFPGSDAGSFTTTNLNYGSASFTYAIGLNSLLPVTTPVLAPSYSVGQTVTLTAASFGTSPISYQWYYGNAFTPIVDATNSTLVLSNIQPVHTAGNDGYYSVSAKNAFAGPIMSTNPTQALVATIPSTPPQNIMPLGDSITYGAWGIGGYRAPLYAMLLNANFNLNYVGTQTNNPAWLPQSEWYQEGHPGYRIDQIQSGFLGWVSSVPSPDVILLLIVVNDYVQNYNESTATNRLDQLISLTLPLHQS